MKYEHSSIAEQHVRLKRLFIEFCQLAKANVEDMKNSVFVISEDGFSSQAFFIHGRKVRFAFELVFQAGGMPMGQIQTQLLATEGNSNILGTFHFDTLGNLLTESLSLHNIAHQEGCMAVLYNTADQVVDHATV
jgi:hypothetical protein